MEGKEKITRLIFSILIVIVTLSGCLIAYDSSLLFRKIFNAFSLITIIYWALLITFKSNKY